MSEVLELDKKDFSFHEKIGTGHYGCVIRATYHGTSVAIKFCVKGSDCVVDNKKLRKEAKRVSSLSHNNIVRLHSLVLDDRRNFVGVAFEYMPGGSLLNAMTRLKNFDKYLPWALKVRLMLEVSEAIEYMHSMQFVHRDIKAANILLSKDLHAKLADFELTRPKDPTTTTVQPYTTASHTPPEILTNITLLEKYYPEYDIYSFGITMFEIMAQQGPYDDEENVQLQIYRVEHKKERPDTSKIPPATDDYINNAVNATLIPLMKKCWDQEPANRPMAEQIASEIRKVYEPLKQDAEKAVEKCAPYALVEKRNATQTQDERMDLEGPKAVTRSDQKVIQNSQVNIGNQYTVVNQGNGLQTRHQKWVNLTEEEAKERLDLRRNDIYLSHENDSVSPEDLSSVAKLLGSDTKLLAPCLLIKDGELDNIVHNNQAFGLEEINMKMLLKWSEKSTATYKWLATACLSLGRMDLINILNQPA